MFSDNQDLAHIQRSTLSLIKAFDGICKREGISYFICGGTLLGAMRHRGFIPWDDDADVAMTREDYRRLERVLISDPPEGTYWESISNPNHFPTNHFCGKLCMSETMIEDNHPPEDGVCNHFGIDVFPFDTRPRSLIRQFKQAVLSYFYQHLSLLLFGGASGKFRVLKKVLRVVLRPFFVSAQTVADRFMRVAGMGEGEDSPCYISLCGRYGYRRESYPKDWFRSSVQVMFEGLTLPAPIEGDAMLCQAYGKNWRMPPKLPLENAHYRVNTEEHCRKKAKGVTLVLATKGRTDEVREFLKSMGNDVSSLQVIIADQNEDDRVDKILRELALGVEVEHVKLPPIGVSAARNAVLGRIKYEIVAFPDDDCLYYADTLKQVKSIFNSHPEIDILLGGGNHDGRVGKYRLFHHGEMYLQFYRFEAVKTIGEFDTELGPGAKTDTCFGGDDSDYLARGAIAGLTILRDKSIRVFHPPQDTASFSREKIIGYGRTRMAVLKKNSYPFWFYYLNIAFPIIRILMSPSKTAYYVAMLKGRLGRC